MTPTRPPNAQHAARRQQNRLAQGRRTRPGYTDPPAQPAPQTPITPLPDLQHDGGVNNQHLHSSVLQHTDVEYDIEDPECDDDVNEGDLEGEEDDEEGGLEEGWSCHLLLLLFMVVIIKVFYFMYRCLCNSLSTTPESVNAGALLELTQAQVCDRCAGSFSIYTNRCNGG